VSVPRRAKEKSYEIYIQEAARRYGVDPRLIQAVIDVESGGDPRALSPVGARGLMQVMPETGRTLGVHPHLLWDERINILTGTQYLRDQLETFGNIRDALVAYNSGPDTVLLGKPLPAETRAYVPRVIARYRAHRLAQQ
jgi:soluble lytic murein transglycosylase-like protein